MKLLLSRHRRLVGALSGAAITAIALSACSGSPDAAEAGPIELRFTWWGSDSRAALVEEQIAIYEDQNPNITIATEYTDFGSYFDKLSTFAAAGDLPDVVTLTDPYVYSYADNGQLRDLKELADQLPTDDFAEASLANLAIDGAQYGVPAGESAFAIAINPSLFEKAGVQIPDDDTWTWDDYVDTAAAIAGALPDVNGSGLFLNEQAMNVWVRQQGQDFWKANGTEIGFDADTAAEYLEFLLQLRDSGGAATPEAEVEAAGLGLEQSPLALGTQAMTTVAVGQLGSYEASGQDLELLKFPGEADAEATGSWTNPGQWFTIPTSSKHPEEAAKFIDFLVNSTEAAEIGKFDRGVPSNTAVLEAIAPSLGDADQDVAAYFAEIAELKPAPFARQNADAGAALIDAVKRMAQEVLFGQTTPQEAAKKIIAEAESAM